MSRTFGSYMIQPTKDQLRANLRALRTERDAAKSSAGNLKQQLQETQEKLAEAYRLLGEQKVVASLARQKAIA